MEAVELLKGRRSVRKYKEEQVSRDLMNEVMEITRWAPSWTNSQTARWTLIDDHELIAQIGDTAVKGFTYNTDTLKNAPGVAVLSFVKGKSGKMEKYGFSPEEENTQKWEVFDAGIACQQFCLASHAKGIATCIFGIIDEDKIAELIDLQEDETVGSLIVYGYADDEPKPPRRLEVEELVRFK